MSLPPPAPDAEGRLLSVMRQLRVAAYERDYLTNTFTSLCPMFETVTGWPREGFTPEDWNHVIRAVIPTGEYAGRGYLDARRWHTRERHALWTADYLVARPDGTEHWLACSATDGYAPDGRLVSSYGLLQDVTDRRATERSLRESEARYLGVFEASRDPLFLWEVDSLRIIDASPSACAAYGYTRDALRQRRLPDLSADQGTSAASASAQNTSVAFRRHRRQDGTTFPVEISIGYFDLDGRQIGIAAVRDLTERRQAEERLQLALDGADLGLWDWDHRGRTLVVDARAAQLLGYAAADPECQPGHWEQLIHPDDVRPTALARDAYYQGREPLYQAAHRMRCKSGEYRWLLARGRVVERDLAGEPLRSAGTYHDITSRRQAEEELAQSEANLRTFFDRSLDLLMVVSGDGSIVDVNQSVVERLGYAREQLLGRSFLVLCAPPTHREVLAAIRRVMAGATDTMELPIRCADGSEVWVSTRVVRGTWNQQPVLFAVGKDISDVRASEALLSQVFELSDTLMAISSLTDGRLVRVNRAFERATGYGAPEAVGRTAVELGLVPDPELRRRVLAIVDGGEPVTGVEATVHSRGGEVLTGSLSARLVEAHGQAYVLTMFTDLTQLHRAEAERLELQRRVHQAHKLESLGAMAGGVAHDFNNLLTTVLGNLLLAMEEAPAGSALAELLGSSHAAAQRAAGLSRQMLAYTGRSFQHTSRIDLSGLVTSQLPELRAAVDGTTELRLDLTAGLPTVIGDRSQLQQVLTNLVLNAAEAIGPAGGTILIATGEEQCHGAVLERNRAGNEPAPGRYACLRVTDTGPGIEPHVQQRMFDPFFSTKFIGRGLGLSVVMGIVRGHQGVLLVDSAPGAGTTVRVLLRLAETDGPRGAARG